MINWSGRDVNTYCNLVNLKCNIEGYGFVKEQSAKEGTNISELDEINIRLQRTSRKSRDRNLKLILFSNDFVCIFSLFVIIYYYIERWFF